MSDLEFDNFEKVMHQKIIVVPDYQRDYSWGDVELTTIAEDLENLYRRNLDKNEYAHFLGSIVLIPLDEDMSRSVKPIRQNRKLENLKWFNIIDGQQRISTISILLIAVRDYAKEHNVELEEAQSITTILNTGKKDEEGNSIPVLHFSQKDTQNCYASLLDSKEHKFDSRKRGARKVLAAKKHFDETLSKLFDEDADVAENLNSYVNQVIYKLEFVEIDCKQDSDAFQIFESLNATGIPLTPAEQVKNLMVMHSSSVDKSLSSWEKIVELVGEGSLVDFLAQYLFCKRNHRISKTEIYRAFKDDSSTRGVAALLGELETYADIYNHLREPAVGDVGSGALQDIKDLGQKQVYVPLMEAATRFGRDSKEFGKIAEAVLVFIVRHLVCSQSSNKLDQIFSDACKTIKNEANDADAVVAFFRTAQMDDSIFEQMFGELSFPYSPASQRKARVYLKRIEEKSKGSNSPLVLDSASLSVEHIIPKQPSIEELEDWVGTEEAERLKKEDPGLADFSERVIMSVGNLALLYTPENSSANNKTYSSKRKLYQSALVDKDGKNRGIPAEVFALIKELLTDYPDSFSDKSVEARAKKLAKEAACVWS